ncbi:MAG TPA: TolC family outer membrane protein [Gammaproteobacteria bacterium]|nr:TolC family outer membrane protein [Gammaproteobacteria bacterium]
MNSNLYRFIIAACVLGFSQSGGAQDDLMNVYQRALQNDPAIREAEAIYLATLETKPQARSSLLPQLSLNAGATTADSKDPNPATNFQTGAPSTIVVSTETERDSSNYSLNLNQTIYNRTQFVTNRQADKRVLRAESDYQLAKQDLLIRVSEAYFDVLAAADTLAAEQAAREAIGRQLDQANRRFEVGLIAITDVQESQAGYDLSIATEISAQRFLATSREFLREIIDEYISELAGPAEEIPLASPEPADAEEWVRVSLEQNLALNSSRIAADIANDDIAIQRGSRLPTLRLSGSFSESSSDTIRTNIFADGSTLANPSSSGPEGYNFSLNFSLPLYTGGFNSSRIQQAVYQHRAALEALERVARQTERQTRDAYLGVISEISRVQALRQAVQSSETALQATEAGFEVGTRTIVDVLVSQNTLARAQTNFARSRYDYILNVLRLKQAAGSLSVDDLDEVNSWLD